MSYEQITLRQKPDLQAQINQLSQSAWPAFMHHGNVRHWGVLFDTFADFQILLCEPADTVIAFGHTIPLVWDSTIADLPADINEIIERAIQAHDNQREPTTLSALAAIVAPSHQRRGLSSAILHAMKGMAAEHRLSTLIAPVRPTLKRLYPLTPMERYVQWKRTDGSPFDPWMRVHWRLGAALLQVAPNALRVTGTVAEWEGWTGICFPKSGVYVVPGALQPVTIDRERNIGRYEEPNVWMRYSITEDSPSPFS